MAGLAPPGSATVFKDWKTVFNINTDTLYRDWSYNIRLMYLLWSICIRWTSNSIHVYRVRQKSNPLPCLADISIINLNFYKKIYVAI